MDPQVQRVVWGRCIGDFLWRDTNYGKDCGVIEQCAGARECDVVAALEQVECDILHGCACSDPPGYPYTNGFQDMQWLEERFAEEVREDEGDTLDDGTAVRRCARRQWWRAAETLVRLCAAVDHRFGRPEWGRLAMHPGPHIKFGTREDAVLDLAVDAGDVGLCRALLRCEQTAVSSLGGPIGRRVSQYGFGHPVHPRGGLWHSVEALRVGRVDLAAMLVSPHSDGGGGQSAVPLIRSLCNGDIPWMAENRQAVNAAARGVAAEGHLANEMMRKMLPTSHMGMVLFRELFNELSRCRIEVNSLSDSEARDELQQVLDMIRAN